MQPHAGLEDHINVQVCRLTELDICRVTNYYYIIQICVYREGVNDTPEGWRARRRIYPHQRNHPMSYSLCLTDSGIGWCG